MQQEEGVAVVRESRSMEVVRWIAVVPAGVVALVVVPVIWAIVNTVAGRDGWGPVMGRLFSGGIGGFVFVMAGALVAPKFRLYTAIGMCVLFGVLNGVLVGLLLSGEYVLNSGNPVVEGIALGVGVAAAIGACIYAHDEYGGRE